MMTDAETRVRECAKCIERITLANGFEPNTWSLIPGRLMLVITELDEMTEELEPGLELADVTLRLLNILEALFPRWVFIRGERRSARAPAFPEDLWTVVKFLCKAMKSWRARDPARVQTMLELAVCECFALAYWMKLDLLALMEAKIKVVALRPPRHGAIETL